MARDGTLSEPLAAVIFRTADVPANAHPQGLAVVTLGDDRVYVGGGDRDGEESASPDRPRDVWSWFRSGRFGGRRSRSTIPGPHLVPERGRGVGSCSIRKSVDLPLVALTRSSPMKPVHVIAFAALGLGLALWVSLGRGEEPKEKPVPAPEFDGVTAWVNAKPLKLADQKGKVVVLHFWTNGCVNCVNNYPHYRAWQDKYKDAKDFLMVGVHAPQFDAEKDVDRIKERMAKNKLTFAVAVDDDLATWKAWDNRHWPCVYRVDKAGNVRQRWEGELGDGGVKKLTAQIDELRKEDPPKGK